MTNTAFIRLSTLLATVLLAFGMTTRAQAEAYSSIGLLDDAYATMAQSNHDYKGHRVLAMKQIDKAIRELGGRISGHGHGHEAQGTSDAQMRAAADLVQQASPGLPKKALRHANMALQQINTALAIR
jgi:hypothetical protein